MRIGLLLNKNHQNYSIFLAFLIGLKIENVNFDIYSYYELADISKSIKDSKLDYIIICNQFAYIDIKKLRSYLIKHKPKIGLIGNSFNIGFLILNKKYYFSKYKHMDTILQLLPQETISLNKLAYIGNLGIFDGKYHSSIFSIQSDKSISFSQELQELKKKEKVIFYNKKQYILKIGKNFFVDKLSNTAFIDKRILQWDNNRNKWKSINKS